MYQVTLVWDLKWHKNKEDKEFRNIIIQKDIQLPFPPSRNISLGLEKNSYFHIDETRVGKTMFLVVENKFLAKVRDPGFFTSWEDVKFFFCDCDDGWRLKIEQCFISEDLKDALSVVEKDNCIITFPGSKLYFEINPDEKRFLDEVEKQSYEVMVWGYSRTQGDK